MSVLQVTAQQFCIQEVSVDELVTFYGCTIRSMTPYIVQSVGTSYL